MANYYGTAGADILFGVSGDTLDGAEGDDLLFLTLRSSLSPTGLSVVDGGSGFDTFRLDLSACPSAATMSLSTSDGSAGTVSVNYGGSAEIVQMTGIERYAVIGSAYADQLVTGSGNDLLDGGAGADSLTGGLGDDTYVVDNVGDKAIETSASGGYDRVQSAVSFTLGANVEMLTLTGTAAINATGNGLANVLIGNSAANKLNGGGGADMMSGGAGNDSYYVNDAGDVVQEAAGEGTDLVFSYLNLTLGDNVENLSLLGSATIGTGNMLNNVITGNSAANSLYGMEGADTLNGGLGADTMWGGVGNDTYIVDNIDDWVRENPGEGVDLVKSSIGYVLPENVEKLMLTGSAEIYGSGNALANTITGNSAGNMLSGLAGADTLSGAAGDDTLHGGTGNDRLTGGTGADGFVFDTALDATTNVDRITDFSPADDSIYLSRTIFSAFAVNEIPAETFRQGTAALDADDRIIYDSTTGKIYYDADGNGAGEQVLFAIVGAGTSLTNLDFIAYGG